MAAGADRAAHLSAADASLAGIGERLGENQTRISLDGTYRPQGQVDVTICPLGESRRGGVGYHGSRACCPERSPTLSPRKWPPWWEWELELSPHVLKRMVDRRFTEIDLRRMLSAAKSYQRDVVKGRWLIDTAHRRHHWQVIVEPDTIDHLLVVVTAYPVE